MADVIELPAGDPPGAGGSFEVFAGTGADGGLLVDADDDRSRRWAKVLVADLGCAGEEVKVVAAGQPAADPVGP